MKTIIALLGCTLAAALFPLPAWSQPPVHSSGAVIVIDPANKQSITGNTSIALAWGEQFSPPQQFLRGFINLREAMLRYTRIETDIVRNLKLGDARLLNVPFVVVTVDNGFELTTGEKANVKKYLENGGFMYLDNAIPVTERSPAEASLKQMIRDVLGTVARFKPIPNDFPLYTCFWEFTDGPPIGSEIGVFSHQPRPVDTATGVPVGSNVALSKPVHYLEGVWIGERLAVVYSNKGYIRNWTMMTDNIPQLKMGVNLVVFSLIQPGGLAKRQ